MIFSLWSLDIVVDLVKVHIKVSIKVRKCLVSPRSPTFIRRTLHKTNVTQKTSLLSLEWETTSLRVMLNLSKDPGVRLLFFLETVKL